MTGTAQERSVYRYFDLADCFVQILALDEVGLAVGERPGLGRAGYRKMVIEACMPEFRSDLEGKLDQLFPDDPLMVEDLLYQLCVEVNPCLDIHEVRLTVDAALQSREPAVQEKPSEDTERSATLDRLRDKACSLESALRKEIVGQDRAVTAVARAVRSAAAGLGEGMRPLASFLFAGRTGTGKTELARCVAKHLFQTPELSGVIRIDCSEFALAHEYSKLIGAPPGYVGHDDGGQLTDAVAAAPESVILFDEIEKAHPKLHNLMLQILEEGALTDGKGKRVSFARTLVIMTSNCGAEDVTARSRAVGFGTTETLGRASIEEITEQALQLAFTPEFLGRVGSTVTFDELGEKAVKRIAAIQLADLKRRAERRGLDVTFTPAVAGWVAKKGFRPESGARELRRVIAQELEPELSERLLEGGEAERR
ncbi:MAG: AAA family ATPase, partial [Planctomycetota bacterium]